VANVFNTVDWLTMESLRTLINKSQVAQFFNTDYNKEFTREFAPGETVRVKLPQRFTIRDGLGYSPQPITRKYTTVAVDQIFGVDFEWDSYEKAVKMERGEEALKREYIDPAMNQIATELDSRAANWAMLNTNNVTGVLGTAQTSPTAFAAARTVLQINSCPAGERGMIVTPQMMADFISTGTSTTPQFNPSSEISRQYKEGSVGKYGGFDWYESNNLYTQTAGTWASTVSVNGANQSGSSLKITATAGDTFNQGDTFTIASVNNVNPVNRRSTGALKQFIVMQSLTAVGGGNAADVLQISPAIAGPGDQYQNVDSLPATAAALTLWPGTASPNGKTGVCGLALHRDAFALVGVKLENPKASSVEVASQQRDPATGISIAFVRQFDGVQRKMINRFDVCIGFGNLYPDNCAVRIAAKV
jgi:P22 coat protein - gene protein 5